MKQKEEHEALDTLCKQAAQWRHMAVITPHIIHMADTTSHIIMYIYSETFESQLMSTVLECDSMYLRFHLSAASYVHSCQVVEFTKHNNIFYNDCMNTHAAGIIILSLYGDSTWTRSSGDADCIHGDVTLDLIALGRLPPHLQLHDFVMHV